MILEVIFWLIVLITGFTYLGYPLILHLLSVKARGNRESRVTHHPSVTLLISAYNEEAVIRRKIENSLQVVYPDLTIAVVSDGSTDRTVEICREYQDRIRLFAFQKNVGKNRAINRAMQEIDSDVVVFSDANAYYKSDTITELVQPFLDERVGCVVGNLVLSETGNSNVSRGEGLYWKYEHWLKMLESRFGSLLIANGAIFGVRRKLMATLHPEIANDFQIPMNISELNKKVIYEPRAVAIEKTASDSKDEFHRKIRIINRGLRGFCQLRKRIRGFRLFEFVCHKLLRWFSGIMFLMLFLLNLGLLHSGFFVGLLILQLLFYFLAFLGYLTQSRWKVLYLPFYINLINLASTIAILQAMSGKYYSKWVSPVSSR